MKQFNALVIKYAATLFALLLLLTSNVQAQSETEPNNSFATSNLLAYNTQGTGTINCAGDANDYFKVSLPTDGTLRIYLQATNTGTGNGYVPFYVYDKAQNEIGINHRYIGNNTNIAVGATVFDTLTITCRAADTTYFLFSQGIQCFSYKLSYQMLGDNTIASDTGRNENFVESNYINAGDTVKGKINYIKAGSSDASDYYKTLLPSDGIVKIYLEATNTSDGNGYVGFYVYDKAQNEIGIAHRYIGNNTNIAPGTTVFDTLTINCRSTDSTYFLINQGSQCFTYRLRYEMIGDNIIVSDTGRNENFAESNYINAGDTVKGKINYIKAGSSDANDYYKTLLPSDGIVKIYLEATNTGNGNGYVPFYVYDKAQNEIGIAHRYIGNNTNIAPGATVFDTLTINCRSTDSTYFLVNQGTQCFTYRLRYEMIGDNIIVSDTGRNETFAEANYINISDTVKGKINYVKAGFNDENDYYKTSVPGDGSVRVYIQGTNTGNSNGYAALYIYDKNQNQIGFSYINNTNVPAGATVSDSITLYCRAADSLYFLVYRGSQCFTYKLNYTLLGGNAPILSDTGRNETFAEANYISVNENVAGRINNSRADFTDANDYYKSLVPLDGTVRVFLEATNTSNGNGYVSFYAYDKAQNQIANKYIGNNTNIPPGVTVFDTLDINCRLSDSTYFLIYQGSQCFNYKMRYSVIGTANEVDIEPNNTFAQAINMSMRDTVKGNINNSKAGFTDENDYYKTKLVSDGNVRLYLEATNTSTSNGYVALYVYDKNHNQILFRYIGNNTNVPAKTTIYDTVDVKCQPQDTVYFLIYRGSGCFNYKLSYDVSLGVDTTVMVCPGFTTNISILYNTKPFSTVKYENLASPGPALASTVVGAGTYRVSVYNGVDACSRDTAIITVSNYPKPNPAFTINSNPQCFKGNSFSFTNTSSISAGTMTYQWTFGDNTASSTTTSPVHSYTAPGTFNVKVVATSNNGCKDSVTIAVTVNPSPLSGFTINSNAQCVNGNSYTFTNTSTISSGTLTHEWNFGDNTSSTSLSPTHVYLAAGTYAVQLIETSNFGCKDTTTQSVTVYPKPTPNFTVNSTTQCFNGNSFAFTNTSTISSGTITQNVWNFGDNTALSTTVSSSHTYTAPGTYNVKLVTTSNNGCKDSITIAVTVNPTPIPGFTINSSAQCVNGNSYSFTSTSTISSGTISYGWSFGDNTSSALQNPVHVYLSAGTFAVKLVVTSNNGCKDSVTQNVTVYPKPTPGFTINNTSQCFTGNSFSFTNTSTITSPATITYQWSFGDNTSSTLLSPTKAYTTAGTYVVKLVVTSNNGCKDSTTQSVTVNPNAVPSFTVNTTPQCLKGNNFLFTNTSTLSSGTVTYQWNFGDNTTATGANASHAYAAAGTFQVKLIATTGSGCKDSVSLPVTVNANPDLGADRSITISCSGGTADITGLYTTTGLNPVYSTATPTAAAAGSYTLIITNTAGCKDTANITVIGAPMADVPSAPNLVRTANRECTDPQGWTNYYNDNGTPADVSDDIIVLSLKKNGQNIGTVGDGTFVLRTATTAGAGSNTAVMVTNPMIYNSTGYYAMNRYWEVNATVQPTANVGVRFYYNTQDLNDVNGSQPSHNVTHQQLLFYKTNGNPNPTTNLAGSTELISILFGTQPTTTSYTYTQVNATMHYAEFMVSKFSGGGGGATGNLQALPIKLQSFKADLTTKDVNIEWKIQEVNTSHYFIQRSINGTDYENAGRKEASGSGNNSTTYQFTDPNVLKFGVNKLYYRLQIIDKDGTITYSNVVTISLKGRFGITIYPNPVKHMLFVTISSASSSEKTSIVVIDMKGRMVMRKEVALSTGSTSYPLNVASLAKGMYVLKVITKDEQHIEKFIKE